MGTIRTNQVDACYLAEYYENYFAADIIPTYDCNYNCNYCCEPLTNKVKGTVKLSDVEAYVKYLRKINNSENVRNIFIKGGEVTLLPFDFLKEIARIVKENGFRSVITTNGSMGETLLKLDGSIDTIIISHHEKQTCMPDWANRFTKTEIIVSKLINVETFPTFESFKRFIAEVRVMSYRSKFITYNGKTTDFEKVHPKWVDEELLKESQVFYFKIVCTCLYDGIEIRCVHIRDKLIKRIIPLKLHPNGAVNRVWEHCDPEINYK